ncbi:MAG: endonuclease/exonuclease/phosphatase family protein [Bacteroidales bacterium]|nr:endonuclease/exonuclease/phosphatase family protein [Bacteroidales bacterium]
MPNQNKPIKSVQKMLLIYTIRIFFGLLLLLIFVVGIFLLYLNIQDFNPASHETLKPAAHAYQRQVPAKFRLISWNIGYGGLGKSMDFFYDGGQRVRAGKEQSEEWLHGITAWIAQQADTDFLLLQEVDFDAKRTYRKNQLAQIAPVLPNHEYVSAINYQVPFVPVPLREPMGAVKAGMLSFSAYQSLAATRHAYPQIAGWPDRMFLLDRCFIESRFATTDNKELVILNTHNSAFIDDAMKMNHELKRIQEKMLLEYSLGNYVIAGGDWNMNPPAYVPETHFGGHRFVPSAVAFPQDFFPAGWTFAFDAKTPSNRFLDEAYNKGITGSTTLDYFILSPNIKLEKMETIDLNFKNSDHNPVVMEVSLQH